MITQLTVDREIEKLFTEIKQKTATRPTDLKYESKLANQITRLENKIDYYNSVRRYLESKPSEESLRSEVSRIKKTLERLDDKYEYWCNNVRPKNLDFKSWRSTYNKDTGYTKLKTQLKTLEFIIDG